MQRALGRALLVLGGLFLGSLVAELCVRTLFDVYRCREGIGWTFAPGKVAWKLPSAREFSHSVGINALGFHDRERSFEKPAGAYRVLLTGDSMIAAIHVPLEESLGAVLERRLAAAALPGRRIEVINAGVDGYGQAQQLVLFREELSKFHADLVLSGAFLGNDLADNFAAAGNRNHYLGRRCGRPYFELRGGELVAVEGGALVRPVHGLLDRLLRASVIYSNFAPQVEPPPDALSFPQSGVFFPEPPPGVAASWQLTRRLLLAMRDEVDSRGARLVILLTPDKESVGQAPGYAAHPPWESLDYATPWRMLRDFLDEERIDYIDLAPRLRAQVESGGELPYYRVNTHWNALGNALAAEEIEAWLARNCARLEIPLASCGS